MLRDARQRSPQLAETPRTVDQRTDNLDFPFANDGIIAF
jgi:hypothetical protein